MQGPGIVEEQFLRSKVEVDLDGRRGKRPGRVWFLYLAGIRSWQVLGRISDREWAIIKGRILTIRSPADFGSSYRAGPGHFNILDDLRGVASWEEKQLSRSKSRRPTRNWRGKF